VAAKPKAGGSLGGPGAGFDDLGPGGDVGRRVGVLRVLLGEEGEGTVAFVTLVEHACVAGRAVGSANHAI
jgi:hypothetical protein